MVVCGWIMLLKKLRNFRHVHALKSPHLKCNYRHFSTDDGMIFASKGSEFLPNAITRLGWINCALSKLQIYWHTCNFLTIIITKKIFFFYIKLYISLSGLERFMCGNLGFDWGLIDNDMCHTGQIWQKMSQNKLNSDYLYFKKTGNIPFKAGYVWKWPNLTKSGQNSWFLDKYYKNWKAGSTPEKLETCLLKQETGIWTHLLKSSWKNRKYALKSLKKLGKPERLDELLKNRKYAKKSGNIIWKTAGSHQDKPEMCSEKVKK